MKLIFLSLFVTLHAQTLTLADRCMKPGLVKGKPGLVNDPDCAAKKTAKVLSKIESQQKLKEACAKAVDPAVIAICKSIAD